jgi:hypothetical protein
MYFKAEKLWGETATNYSTTLLGSLIFDNIYNVEKLAEMRQNKVDL